MNKLFINRIAVAIFMVLSIRAYAQTDGISYQAVILSNEAIELPGYNSQNDLLVNAVVAFEFTITGVNNNIIYQETQLTNTDGNGLVNLIIGQGVPIIGNFNEIEWNGNRRGLEVKIDLTGGSSFAPLATQDLLYIPFAAHRNITASGNLNISGSSSFEQQVDVAGSLMVRGDAILTENISIDGDTAISGLLTVDGGTILNLNSASNKNDLSDALTVNGATALQGTLSVVGVTELNSELFVEGDTLLENSLTVSDTSTFNSLVEINAPADLNENLFVRGNSRFMSAMTVYGFSNFQSGMSVLGDVDLNSEINVRGDAEIESDLAVLGTTTLSSTLRVNNGSPTYLTGILNVDGATDFNNTINIDGVSTLNNSLTVTGNSPVDLTGSLNVDGVTDLNNNLVLDGTATMNSSLQLTGSALLNNTLTVAGATQINNTLSATGDTALGNSLTVAGATQLNGTLNVSNNTALSGTLAVVNTADFSNRVTISAGLGSGSSNYDNYPLRVQGSANGIAVKTTAGTPNNNHNFMTFFNSSGTVVGRIEGETWENKQQSRDYIYDTTIYAAEIALAGINVGTAAIPIVVAGFGASAGPCGGCIAQAAAELAMATANLITYNTYAAEDIGVTYQSGSGDYAEWLERLNSNETISEGDIVGVYNGKISKYISEDVQRILVISTSPAVLGNMPPEENKEFYERVAFLGQVPVKVKGDVFAGDYILPSGENNGVGIGVAKSDLKAKDYKKIVGVAWTSSLENTYGYVKMAIGLNTNDMADLVDLQQKEIQSIEKRLATLEAIILQEKNGESKKDNTAISPRVKSNNTSQNETDILNSIPPFFTDEMILETDKILQNIYNASTMKSAGLEKLMNDKIFKQKVFERVKKVYREQYLKFKSNY